MASILRYCQCPGDRACPGTRAAAPASALPRRPRPPRPLNQLRPSSRRRQPRRHRPRLLPTRRCRSPPAPRVHISKRPLREGRRTRRIEPAHPGVASILSSASSTPGAGLELTPSPRSFSDLRQTKDMVALCRLSPLLFPGVRDLKI